MRLFLIGRKRLGVEEVDLDGVVEMVLPGVVEKPSVVLTSSSSLMNWGTVVLNFPTSTNPLNSSSNFENIGYVAKESLCFRNFAFRLTRQGARQPELMDMKVVDLKSAEGAEWERNLGFVSKNQKKSTY